MQTLVEEAYGDANRALEGYAFAGINMKDCIVCLIDYLTCVKMVYLKAKIGYTLAQVNYNGLVT